MHDRPLLENPSRFISQLWAHWDKYVLARKNGKPSARDLEIGEALQKLASTKLQNVAAVPKDLREVPVGFYPTHNAVCIDRETLINVGVSKGRTTDILYASRGYLSQKTEAIARLRKAESRGGPIDAVLVTSFWSNRAWIALETRPDKANLLLGKLSRRDASTAFPACKRLAWILDRRGICRDGSSKQERGLGRAALLAGPRVIEPRLRLGIDGIILQLAGELFFDDPITRAHRHQCRALYLRILMDFTFALVYSHKGIAPVNLPKTKDGASSGTELVIELGEFFEPLDARGMGKPADLLSDDRDSATRSVIAKELLHLDQWPQHRQQYMWDLLRREASLYLGNHPSLAGHKAPFVFGCDQPYFSHGELESRVAGAVVEKLLKSLRRSFPGPSPEALEVFVRQFWLTHLTIGHWYRSPTLNYSRLPVVTRVYAKEIGQALMERIANLHLNLAQQILGELPTSFIGQERKRVLWWLYEKARDDRFKEVRGKVTELDDAVRAKAPPVQIHELCTHINKLASRVRKPGKHFWSLANNGVVVIVRPGSHYYGELDTLYQIFPELALEAANLG